MTYVKKPVLPALHTSAKVTQPDLPSVADRNYTSTVMKYGNLALPFSQLDTNAKTIVAAINELYARRSSSTNIYGGGSIVIPNPIFGEDAVIGTSDGDYIVTNTGYLLKIYQGDLVGDLYSISIDGDIYTIDTGVAYLNELVDVTIEEPHSGQVLKYDGEQWINAEDASGISKLSELEDVELSEDPTQGQVLTYDGEEWINSDPASVPSTLDDLTNVDIDAPVNDQVLTYKDGEWVNSVAVTDLESLTDVSITSPQNGQMLQYEDGEWVNAVPVSSLESLSDVDITSATNGQVLKYNNGEWINAADLDTNKLSDLQDVDVASVTAGQVLKFDGTEWVGGDDGPDTLEELTDTSISSKQNNDEIVYNSTSQKWENKQVHKTLTSDEYNALSSAEKNNGTIYFISDIPAVTLRPEDLVSTNAQEGQLLWYNGSVWEPVYGITLLQDNDVLIYDETLGTWRNGPVGSVADLEDLNDVSITSAVDGQVLKYNGSEWVNAEDSGVASLEDLTDVDITNPTTNQVLTYNGEEWVNETGAGTWEGTQAEYDLIEEKDPNIVYYITDAPAQTFNADAVMYNNTSSGLSATTVQSALDEIVETNVYWTDLTGTLMAGATSIQFHNSVIKRNSTVNVYVDSAFFGVSPISMSVIDDYVTLGFEEQTMDMPVKVRIS